MKKICFIIFSMEGGGAEKMVMYISNEIASKPNNEVFLILFRKTGVNLKKLSPKIKIIDLKSKLGLKGIFKLLKVLKKITPSHIFISLGPLNAIFSLFLFLFTKTKVIARETNIPSVINKLKSKSKKIYIIIDLLYRITYRFYDLIVVQSDDMLNDLIINYKIPRKKIKKINNLVDFELIDKLKLAESENIEELFSSNKIYGIGMGRLTEQKGFDMLIRHLKSVSVTNIQIYILGEGEEKESLEKLIEDLNLDEKIKILGFDKNPYQYLNRADFFIFPSRVEGFPNSLIEALGMGVPAIVNDCQGGIKEIIFPEFNGEIVEFEKENVDLEKYIKKVLSYDREKIKKNIIDKFDKRLILKKYLECFE